MVGHSLRIAFIGGTRFIGFEAVSQTVKRGHEVTVLHRGTNNTPLPNGVTETLVDRDNRKELHSAIHRLGKLDVVVDTFAMTGAQASCTIEALRGQVPNVVVLSSQDVYAQFGRLNGHEASLIEDLVTEKSPLTVPYPFRGIVDHDGGDDYDKKIVEDIFRKSISHEFEAATILRLPATYGSRDNQRRFGSIIDRLDAGHSELLHQDGARWRWTMSHVANVAHAIVLAAETKAQGFSVFNVGDKEAPTMRERINTIARLMGKDIRWHEVDKLPSEFEILGRMPNDFVVSTDKIRNQLGFSEVIDQESAYRDLIDWTRKSCRQKT